MQWHKRTIIVQKLTLVVELWALVSPLSAIAQAHDPTVIGSIAPRKGPHRFCPHRSDHCHALMLTCRNSPSWQHCERCNNVLSSFWPPWLDHNWTVWSSCEMCVNWNEPPVSRIQLYKQPSDFNDAWVRAGGCKRSLQKIRIEPASRSSVATCDLN